MPFLDYFFKRQNYELFVSHYYRGQSPELGPYPFHRAIFLRTSPVAEPDAPKGTLYQLVPTGISHRFFQQTVEVSKPDSFAGLVKIGDIRPNDVYLVETILNGIPIDYQEPALVGHIWARDAVRALAKGGFVDLDLLSKLYLTLEEQEKDFLFTMLREQPSPRGSVCVYV
jgi:hypothetical protein